MGSRAPSDETRSDGLHHAMLRIHCVARLKALHASRYGDLSQTEDHARYWYASRLIYEVEQFEPNDFADVGDEREMLALCIQVALEEIPKTFDRRWSKEQLAMLSGAIRAEADVARALLDAPLATDIRPLPYRKLTGRDQYAHAWESVCRHWGGDPNEGPHGGPPLWEVSYADVRKALARSGIERVWLLHPLGHHLSVVADVTWIDARAADGNPGWFPPMPTYLTAPDYDWYLYVNDSGGPDRAGGWIYDELSART